MKANTLWDRISHPSWPSGGPPLPPGPEFPSLCRCRRCRRCRSARHHRRRHRPRRPHHSRWKHLTRRRRSPYPAVAEQQPARSAVTDQNPPAPPFSPDPGAALAPLAPEADVWAKPAFAAVTRGADEHAFPPAPPLPSRTALPPAPPVPNSPAAPPLPPFWPDPGAALALLGGWHWRLRHWHTSPRQRPRSAQTVHETPQPEHPGV